MCGRAGTTEQYYALPDWPVIARPRCETRRRQLGRNCLLGPYMRKSSQVKVRGVSAQKCQEVIVLLDEPSSRTADVARSQT
eukprot:5008324-Heterocapsa_arctica.AAC.1